MTKTVTAPVARSDAPAPASDDAASREERQRIADQAEHSLRLEGLGSSAFGRALEKRWINGEISNEECRAALREHYGESVDR